jgi:hypothetical protein
MTRAWVQVCLRVVVWTLVFVLDKKSDWGTKGDAMFNARLQVHKVFLVPLWADQSWMADRMEKIGLTEVVRLLWPGRLRLSCT